MSNPKENVLYVKGVNNMFHTESEADEETEDIWDDKKLNDAYDKALKIANVEVARRVAMSTNSGQPGNKSKNKKDKNKAAVSQFQKKEMQTKWKAGMPCRALYEGDGIEYEAFVLRIINEKECVVRFLGYENSEIVSINTLKPTLGKNERTRQIEQALIDKADDRLASQSPNNEKMQCDSDRIPSPGSTELSYQLKKKPQRKKKSKNHNNMNMFDLPEIPMPNMDMLRNLGQMDMPIPPPPPMAFPSNHADSEDQAVSSMLLSWYMSGYYTGLYQGLKRAQECRRNV